MNNNMYDALELCLQELENGADIETVLSRYPEHANELRPILETSVMARTISVQDASADVVRRNRAKVLQHAAQMRESRAYTTRRLWSVPLRRVLVTLVVVGVLFISGTGLVRAASTTVPGDNLYPVKRAWEDVLVLFTFNLQAREALEVEHENERLHELEEVFTEGRSVQVDFSGLVTRQNGDLWLVSGIPVALSAQTDLPTQPIAVGDGIHVVGITQSDGAVLAQRIELLPAGVPLPEVEDDDSFEFEEDNSGNSNEADPDNSGEGSANDSNENDEDQTSGPESESNSGSSEPREESFNGVVESINGNILIVTGQIVNVSSAEINGTLQVGASAKVEGYYDANGVFIVIRIEIESSGSDGGDGSDSGSDDNDSNSDGTNDNNDNSNDDNANDDGGGDNDGGNDNSGSGGGDDD